MSAEKKAATLLWITPKWPLPPEDGARRASYNLIRAVTAQGATVDLLALAGQDEDVVPEAVGEALNVRRVFVLRRAATPKSRLAEAARALGSLLLKPALPITMRNYGGGALHGRINKILAGDWRELDHRVFRADDHGDPDWQGIVYDGAHAASHAASFGRYRPGRHGLPVFYRAHNREAQIWQRMAGQCVCWPKKVFLFWQARLMASFEDSLVQRSAGTLTVSKEDLRAFSALVPADRLAVVPIGFEFPEITPLKEQSPGGRALNQILFVGRLDWQPNLEGLIWFLREVWPAVVKARSDLKLVIAGSGQHGALLPYLGQERIDFLGRVEDLESLYRASLLCLVPVFYGSGTRVKAIEASRFARPCLSTQIGIEGLGLEAGKSYYRAETAEEWINCLAGLDTEAALQVGKTAWSTTRSAFELRETAGKFLEAVEKACLTANAQGAGRIQVAA